MSFTRDTLAHLWGKITGLFDTVNNDISTLDDKKVDKADGMSLIKDTEIERLSKVDNYDDSNIKNSITSLEFSKANKSEVYTKTETNTQIANEISKVSSGASNYLGIITELSSLSNSAKKGEFYRVSVAWDGVHVNDFIMAEKDNPTQNIDGVNWSLLHNEENTDKSVTSVSNHYIPTKTETISAVDGKLTDITNSATGTQVVTGVEMDAAGHITGVTSVALKASGAGGSSIDRYIDSASFDDDTLLSENEPLKMTLTRAGDDVDVVANLPKVSSTTPGVVPKGNTVAEQTTSTKFLREDGTWNAPSYPTTLPASDTTDEYSSTGTTPVSGKAVAAAIKTLNVTGEDSIDAGKTIASWNETDGVVNITTQDISITKSQISDFPTEMTPSSHNQDSSTINVMTGYKKATESSSITTDDSLNEAIGKLEKALDEKQPSGSYASSDHTHDEYVNQNAFSNITVDDSTVEADKTTDTLTLISGNNVTISADTTNDTITISATDTVYTHPTYTSKQSGLYKVTVDETGHVSEAIEVEKDDITALGIPGEDTDTHYESKNVIGSSTETTTNTVSELSNGNVYLNSVENGAVTSSHKITGSGATNVTTDSNGNVIISSSDTSYDIATQDKDGLMSSEDKKKLDDIDEGANNYTLPKASSSELGGVKTGDNITNTDGTISITSANVTDALGYTPIESSSIGVSNGIAELDENGKVPSSQLPSYVDDVIEYDNMEKFPTTGESGKIYIDISTNKTYRWTGTMYTEISASLALGETSSTAYRGDRGKTAYEHSQSTHARTDATKTESSNTNGNIKIDGSEVTVYTHPTGSSSTNPHGTTKADVGLENVGNFKAVSTDASQGLTDTEKSNARANIGAGTSSFSGSFNDLADKPTIDSVLSDTSTNAVQNKIVKAAIDNKLDKEEGKSLVSDKEISRLANLENYDDTSIKNDIALNLSSIGMSKKNLLKPSYTTNSSTQSGGCTFTINDDKSITVSGKNNTDDTIFFPITMSLKLPLGRTYKLNGCPSNNKTDDNKIKVYWRVEKPSAVICICSTDIGNSFTSSTNLNPTYAQICVNAGADFTDNPCTFYPMIRYADITDDTYEPYTEDLQTQINSDIALNLSSIGMSKKNLLKIVKINKTTDTYSIIKNSDGSVTVNGTFNTNISVTLGTLKTKNGVKYILSGCPQGGSSSSYRLNMRHEGQTTNVYPDIGRGATFTGIDETMSAIVLIYGGTTVDNLTFYPMIRYADITDNTYEPYTEDLQTQIALNLSSIGMSKKNLLPFPQTITKGGITFTCDANGYMRASNTSSDVRQFTVSNSQYSVKLKAGKYILSFVSSTVCTDAFGDIAVLISDNTKIAIIGQTNFKGHTSGSVEFTLDTEQTIYVMSKIFDGVTAVMIRYADITDDTYEPYTDDLQTQINNINADDTGWISIENPDTTVYSTWSVQYRKIGDDVDIYVEIKTASSISYGSYGIANLCTTLPSEIVPSRTIRQIGYISTSSSADRIPTVFSINSSNLRIYNDNGSASSTIPSGTNMYGELKYFI